MHLLVFRHLNGHRCELNELVHLLPDIKLLQDQLTSVLRIDCGEVRKMVGNDSGLGYGGNCGSYEVWTNFRYGLK